MILQDRLSSLFRYANGRFGRYESPDTTEGRLESLPYFYAIIVLCTDVRRRYPRIS
jgi:hypothetical protein